MAPIYAMLKWKEKPKNECLCYNMKDEYIGKLKKKKVFNNHCWCWGDQPKGVYLFPGYIREIKFKQTELWKEDARNG